MKSYLKDRYGNAMGYTEDRGSRKEIFDRYGNRCGYFDGRYTYDKYGNKYGEGDLLARLIP